MTIETILERYEVPHEIAQHALERGAFVLALREAWVGPEISWDRLVKAVIFASLGEQGSTIRKKVGLDKYIVTLIARGVPKYADMILESHDWNQKLYAYCMWHDTAVNQEVSTVFWNQLKKEVEANLLHGVDRTTVHTPTLSKLRSIEVRHYKNPSV